MTERERAPESEQLGRLRAAFVAAESRGASSADPGGQLDPELIWAAARGQLDPEQTAAIVDRLHEDPQLALEWRLALELTADEPLAGEQPPPRAANFGRYATTGLLVAVAAVVLVVIRGPSKPDSDTDPSLNPGADAGADPVLRSSTTTALATALPDGAVVPRARFELSWSAVAGAARYELRLHTETLDPVYEALELRTPRVRIPADALAELDAGAGLAWQVTAVMHDGERVTGPLWRVVLE